MSSQRRCDCESESCHPRANCVGVGTVRTIHSTICAACAAVMPSRYLINPAVEVLHRLADRIEHDEYAAHGTCFFDVHDHEGYHTLMSAAVYLREGI